MPASLVLLGVCAFLLQVCLLTLLAKNKLRSQFPAVFNLIAFNTIATIAFQISARWFAHEYFYIYRCATAISILLCFWVLYAVFVTILKPYDALIDLGKMLFRWASVFLLLAGLVTAISTSGSPTNKVCAVIMLLERCVQLMQCGMLMLLLAFASRLGLSWRSHGMGFGLGIGTFAAWDLAVSYLGTHFPAQQHIFNVANGLVSVGLYGYWAFALILPAPQRKTVLDSPSRLIFQRWNEGLMSSPLVNNNQLALSPVDSFLPGVERTVDRVLARKMSH